MIKKSLNLVCLIKNKITPLTVANLLYSFPKIRLVSKMSKYLFILSLLLVYPAFAVDPAPQAKQASWAQLTVAALSKVPAFIIDNKIPVEIHGRYCGPSHGDPTYSAEPIDGVDHACMRHDQCYDENVGGRYLSCGCDFQLASDLLTLMATSEESEYSAALAVAIVGYFSRSECKCFKSDGSFTLLESPNILSKWMCEA